MWINALAVRVVVEQDVIGLRCLVPSKDFGTIEHVTDCSHMFRERLFEHASRVGHTSKALHPPVGQLYPRAGRGDALDKLGLLLYGDCIGNVVDAVNVRGDSEAFPREGLAWCIPAPITAGAASAACAACAAFCLSWRVAP